MQLNNEDTLVLSLAVSCGLLSPVQEDDVRRKLSEKTCEKTATQLMVDAGWISHLSADALQQIRAEIIARDRSRSPAESDPSDVPTAIFSRPQHETVDPRLSSDSSETESVRWENRFVRKARLASGGLGVIYRADDRQLCREVAVKKLLPKNKLNREAVDRFIREARITGKLEHPGIVPIYAMGLDADNEYFYAMKLVQGAPFKVAIDDFHKRGLMRKYSSPEFRDLINKFIAVCDAIEFAHKSGVVHRDIKPANIMVGSYGETLVVDWGLAKEIRSYECELNTSEVAQTNATNTVEGSVLGTPLYAAPEQLLGKVDATRQAVDVYALGATLHEILVGQPKFAGKSFNEIKAAVVNGQFTSVKSSSPNVPRVLCAICDKAMAHDANDRYLTVAEVRQDLERWLNDLPVRTFNEGVTQKLLRWVRHNPVFVLSLAPILVMLAIVFPIIVYIGQTDFQLGDVLGPFLSCGCIVALVQPINYCQRKLQWCRNHPSASIGLAMFLAVLITYAIAYAMFRVADFGTAERTYSWLVGSLTGSALLGSIAFLFSRFWYASRKKPEREV